MCSVALYQSYILMRIVITSQLCYGTLYLPYYDILICFLSGSSGLVAGLEHLVHCPGFIIAFSTSFLYHSGQGVFYLASHM